MLKTRDFRRGRLGSPAPKTKRTSDRIHFLIQTLVPRLIQRLAVMNVPGVRLAGRPNSGFYREFPWALKMFRPVSHRADSTAVERSIRTPNRTGSWIRKNSETGLNSCESSYEVRSEKHLQSRRDDLDLDLSELFLRHVSIEVDWTWMFRADSKLPGAQTFDIGKCKMRT